VITANIRNDNENDTNVYNTVTRNAKEIGLDSVIQRLLEPMRRRQFSATKATMLSC